MNTADKIRLLAHAVKWRMTWNHHDLDYHPGAAYNQKFITARDAAKLLADEAVVFSSGLAGNGRCTVFFHAIRERFLEEQHPQSLIWIHCGAQGGRGKVPGTIEELGLPGLMKQYISGHVETSKAQLTLAEHGMLQVCILSQGVISLLLEEQSKGNNTLETKVGKGTFIDPSCGRGSALTPDADCSYVKLLPNGKLQYTLPLVQYALCNASYADEEGNIYFHHSTILSESLQAAAAARRNGGKVMVSVGAIIPKNESLIVLKVDEVDYIVVDPYHEQAASIPLKHYWPMFVAGEKTEVKKDVAELKWLNTVLKITPVRDEFSDALARLAASLFVRLAKPGAMVNIGSGFPEEVARVFVENDLGKDLLFTTEAGVYGGLPAPGIFFSACINPIRLEPSSVMFKRYMTKLDITVLGMLQADSEGNVNVSRRGPHISKYGGPGGFTDIVEGARTIIFVGKWMDHASWEIDDDGLHLHKPGAPKIIDHVDEITFSGRHGIELGTKVYYVTNVGIFNLTKEGLELIEIMPGIDIQKDILEQSPAKILIRENVRVADMSILTGEDFKLEFNIKKTGQKYAER